MKKKNIYRNLRYAFLSQIISLAVSFIMAFVVPKILGITDYAYWQLFILFHGYSGILLLGFNDGLYLNIGGLKFEEVDTSKIGSQIRLVYIFQVIVLSLLSIVILLSNTLSFDRKFIFISVVLYALSYNIMIILGYLFQAVNNTHWYSKSILISKILFLLFLSVFFIIKIKNYQLVIIVYLISQFGASIYSIYLGRSFIFSSWIGLKRTTKLIIHNVRLGILLMLAYYTGSFIVGFARLIIENRWGLSSFGLVSFSISIISVLMLFISQFSMVFFPALRTVDENRQIEYFYLIRDILKLTLLPIMMLAIIPVHYFVPIWLPDYVPSLNYFYILIPISIFEIRTNLLGNTFLKVFKKPESILIANVLTLILSLVLISISAFVIRNINLVLYSLVFSLFLRSVLLTYFSQKEFNKGKIKIFVNNLELIILLIYYVLLYLRGYGAIYLIQILVLAFIIINFKQYRKLIDNYIKRKKGV